MCRTCIFIPLNTMFLAILTCFCFVLIILWSDAHCYSCPFIIHRRCRYFFTVWLKILVILVVFACNYKYSYLVKWALILWRTARILRGLRIAARLGLRFSCEITAAIHELSSSIMTLPKVLANRLSLLFWLFLVHFHAF